jgi:hypothetical protein
VQRTFSALPDQQDSLDWITNLVQLASCQLTDVNVPLVFGQNVPGFFGKNVPPVFGQNAPRLFGQIVPPVHKGGAQLKGSDSRLLLIQ